MSRTSSVFAFFAFFAAAAVAGAQNQSAVGRYTGSLRGISGVTGGAMTRVSDVTRLSGSVEISPSSSAKLGVYKVDIRVSTGGSLPATGMMQWSISSGRCNSQVQPLVPPTELPTLEMRSGGNAEVSWEGAVNLTSDGSYQLVVYDKGVREQDIVGCANLKYIKPMK